MQTLEIRTYKKLIQLKTFEERFDYLRLLGSVGTDTFAFDRYLNQKFYSSYEWRRVRQQIILRDAACDLGIKDHDIFGMVMIHHMNPISVDDLVHSSDFLLNPEYLICVSKETHNALHYGTDIPVQKVVERKPNDTCPWRK